MAAKKKPDAIRLQMKQAMMSEGSSTLHTCQLAYAIMATKLYRSWGFSNSAAYCSEELECSDTNFRRYSKLYYDMRVRLKYPDAFICAMIGKHGSVRVSNAGARTRTTISESAMKQKIARTSYYSGANKNKMTVTLMLGKYHIALLEGLLLDHGLVYSEAGQRHNLNAAAAKFIDHVVGSMPDTKARCEAAELATH